MLLITVVFALMSFLVVSGQLALVHYQQAAHQVWETGRQAEGFHFLTASRRPSNFS